jgi:hypothetical protein
MNPLETDDDEVVQAERPEVECPLCSCEVPDRLEDHLATVHTADERARTIAKYVREREETGAIR